MSDANKQHQQALYKEKMTNEKNEVAKTMSSRKKRKIKKSKDNNNNTNVITRNDSVEDSDMDMEYEFDEIKKCILLTL